ncbi:MAG: 3-phosphoshikimate 1-carboxyvinyltransferase [Lachnospiraceae bacterium]|uniref:3-phosphoshikimate 1-carboxyvinyltransferase n=1 Tax=Candidatus Weimeria bifida TaxID=2599074 RepID=A0A6N7IYM6_9FIRM|nr:3-phosphoshikimate 1-carboxyvinyltransferase [Candidatus Weimeria bifida]RRF95666.1 MAG: 3-phosphoshikimate 1-carboxyvinyltransferase [Lachnospiraceae bacterium]
MYCIKEADRLSGVVIVPGDKSISHRGIMLGSIAEGDTYLHGFLEGADCLSSISCFKKMGISIDRNGSEVTIHGKGLHGLSAPSDVLDAGNSGTTTRLMSGILAGQHFSSTITGDESLKTRPMKRVISPLTQMGASIDSNGGCLPMTIHGGSLHGIDYKSPVASAQVKSCVLFAGLFADGKTSVTEPAISRNHTELMLRGFGASVFTDESRHYTEVEPEPRLIGQNITVPGDISSAAYFLAAGLISKNAEIIVENVNTNPTRAGILKVIEAMGGDISYINERTVSGEAVADIVVKSSSLHGTTIEGSIIPALIDELPVIAVMAAYADGTTTIKDAAELKVKESNRIDTVTENLSAMGCDITPTDDGFIIHGGRPLHGAQIRTHKDHRIAMSFAVAALSASGETTLDDPDCVKISYPGFFDTLQKLGQ